MGQFEQINASESGVVQDAEQGGFKNEVAYFIDKHGKRHSNTVKHLKVDDRMANQNVTYFTDQVEMEDGRQYIVGYNTVESLQDAEKDPAQKQYSGSNILVLEGTAYTTKNGGFYKERHDVLARDYKRPSLIVGVVQNYDKFNTLNKTADDMLAIHAFYAAAYGYDQERATTIGTSRGGMLALLLQKRAVLQNMKILHADAMVPCIPTPMDALKMGHPRNLLKMLKNEYAAIKEMERTFEEMRGMHDTIDVLTIRGLITEIKEALALVMSNIAYEVASSDTRDDVADITVQEGDGMSFAHKWPKIYRDHTFVNVDVRPGGGHATSVGKPYFRESMARQEAIANVLHADPANRYLGGAALRGAIDLAMHPEHQLAV